RIGIAAEIAAAAGAIGEAVHPFLDAQIVDVALARGAPPMTVADLLPALTAKEIRAGAVEAAEIGQRRRVGELAGAGGAVQRRAGNEVEPVEVDAVGGDGSCDRQILAPHLRRLARQ